MIGTWRARFLMLVMVALPVLAACSRDYIHEPWMGGRGEQAKQKWVGPPAPHREDAMRTRLLTTQGDH
jgi:hypothetical protein